MNEPYRLRWTNQIVGSFLLAVLLFLLVFSILLLRYSDLIVQKDLYWVEISQDEVDGLQNGAEVLILGNRAGQVSSIEYVDRKSDRIRVSMRIDPEFSKEVFSESVVYLERKLGVGSPILVIRRPLEKHAALENLPSNNRLVNFIGEEDQAKKVTQRVSDAADSIDLIQKGLTPTLKSVDVAAQESVPAFQATQRSATEFTETNQVIRPQTLLTLRAFREATENLEARIESLTIKIQALTENDVPDTLADVRASTVEVNSAAQSIDKTAQDVNEDIAATLKKLSDAADEIKVLAEETREVVRIAKGEAKELPGTVSNVNDTVHDTQNMVEEIRNHPLIRNYSNRASATPQVSPSSVRGGR